MCGRIALYSDPPRLARLLHADLDDGVERVTPHWNLGPTSDILGVAGGRDGRRVLGVYRWGLVPPGARDPDAVRNTFNARAETVATRPAFRASFARDRILVPVDAFYEWQAGVHKQPYAFVRADCAPVVFAGLRARWHGRGGREIRSATVLTTSAGPDVPIHDRQPVVLEPGAWKRWLDPASGRDELDALLGPSPEGTLVRYPVGRAVGDVRNDRPDLLDEVAGPSTLPW